MYCFEDEIKWQAVFGIYILKRSWRDSWWLAAGQISLMSTIFPPTGILHLSLPEWVAHTFMYINYCAFITSLSTYLDKSMVGFFSYVQFPFWWHFCFLINSRQSIYLKHVFFFKKMYFSFLCSATLCLGVVLLESYLDLWIFGELFSEMEVWRFTDSHCILYLFNFFNCVFQFLVIWKRYLITYQLNLITYL